MSGSEMIESFLQYYDRVTNFSAPGYETSEILLFLNNSQDEFIRSILYGERNQPPILPGNSRIEADLYPIIYTSMYETADVYPTEASPYVKWTNEHYIKVPDVGTSAPCQYFIDLLVKLTRTYPAVTASYISCEVINRQNADKFAYILGLNKPHFIKPVCWIEKFQLKSGDDFAKNDDI